ncbi:MAG: hypothetical protein RJB62_1815 [Pseudomonadota bacterium]|jgi:putative endonuclease
MSGPPNRKTAEKGGRRAEGLAALWLRLKWYRVVGRRVRTPVGEIDLIALSPRGILCFIEVKNRKGNRVAAEAVSHRQQSRIARAAELYLSSHPALRHKGVLY